jgi:two-component system cell cycle sensor histidine kinase/response regulator CckA
MIPVQQREEVLLQALENSELQYRRLFETAQDGILIVDARTGLITDANPFLLDMLGYAREQLLGRRLWKIGFFKDRALFELAFATLLQEGYVRYENLPLETRDGQRREVEFVSNLFEADHRKVIQCNIRDITDRRRLEAKLQQVQKMEAVCQLASGVAHDYNNILTSMLLRLTILLDDPDLPEKAKGMLGQLESEAKRAAGLTRQLLMFSRQQAVCLRPLDLFEVLSNLLDMLRRLLSKDVRLEFTGGSEPLWVEADTVMIEQLITNLCLNAQDSMAPEGGRLTIDARLVTLDSNAARVNPEASPGSFVCLSVTDTGCGMNSAALERVFEPFFTTKAMGKGTGLGLSTVYGITKQHKGWMEAASQMGQGSTFRVYLPALTKSAQAGPESPVFGVQNGNETILVVDDEQAVRKMVALGLQLYGYHVLEAGNASEAIQVWDDHEEAIDLLFTDMRMPGSMTGIELFEQLKQRNDTLIGVISSGYSGEIVKPHEQMPEDLTFLPKPYDVRTLVRTVRDCLDIKRARFARTTC